jgi:uncharacterized protein DUF1302
MNRRSIALQWIRAVALLGVVSVASAIGARARAFDIDTGIPDLRLRWDNTVKYSLAARTQGPSDALVDSGVQPTAVNQDDGDRNLRKTLVQNRFDLFSEADVQYRDFGARASGAGWYDFVYNANNDNDSPATVNSVSVHPNQFTDATEKLMGRKAELLDAFVFAKHRFGDMAGTIRAGRHALQWGESLFFGENGIAGGQAPVDFIKLLSVPGSQFKEIIRPVWQVSGQLQVTPAVAIGAYYQLEWERNRLPAAGSYFSTLDFIGDGAERILFGPPGGPFQAPQAFFRSADLSAKDLGQYGLQLRATSEALETDFGLYWIQYHAKDPELYLNPGLPDFATGQVGTFSHVYHENVKAFGASASKTFGQVNFAGEISYRYNAPLVSSAQVVPPGTAADNSHHPLYAVGRSLHANLSWVATMPPSFISREANFLGEIGWNARVGIAANPAALDPNTREQAVGFRFIYEPFYRQVLSGLDLSVPVVFGFNPAGRSSVVPAFNGGVDQGGDVTFGVLGVYRDTVRCKLSYTAFFGSEGTYLDANNFFSFKQAFEDRNYFSFTLSTTI